MGGEQIITVGLSGSSSSGKTTLTAMLSRILPSDKILLIQADDFGKEFEDLPKLYGDHSNVLDADGKDGVYFDRLLDTINHAIAHGELPPSYQVHDFILADLEKATAKFDRGLVEEMAHLLEHVVPTAFKIIVVDGFLLYHDPELRSKLEIKLFLRTSKTVARQRRFGRYGEGAVPEGSDDFWKTRSYFEDAVWPHYQKEHGFLFPGGNVEADIDPVEIHARWGICTPQVTDLSLEDTVRWGVSTLSREIRHVAMQSLENPL